MFSRRSGSAIQNLVLSNIWILSETLVEMFGTPFRCKHISESCTKLFCNCNIPWNDGRTMSFTGKGLWLNRWWHTAVELLNRYECWIGCGISYTDFCYNYLPRESWVVKFIWYTQLSFIHVIQLWHQRSHIEFWHINLLSVELFNK